MRATPTERFEEKIERIPGIECWIWKANTYTDGYGMFWSGTHTVRAHRFSYERYKGTKIPPGLYCLHRCDVPLCVNPAHLFLGTQKENIADMISKGRDLNMQAERAKTHCKRGHLYSDNLRMEGNKRHCRECDRINAKNHYWANK